jgi:N-acetylneuraminic acid mutarotase
MIVWAGQSDPYTVNTGHRYDPATDSWAATTQLSAPRPRANHSAVWTGDEMIVWGGSGFPYLLDTGGRYCPLSGANP